MAEPWTRLNAAADIIDAVRLETQANALTIKALEDKLARVVRMMEDHHETGHEISVKLALIDERLDELKGWRKAADLYRENVRTMHAQFHQESDLAKVENIKAVGTIRVALIGAGGAVLILIVNRLFDLWGVIQSVSKTLPKP